MDRDDLIAQWDDGISPAVGGLEAYFAGRIELDYSLESMRALEKAALALFPAPDAVLDDADLPVVRAVMAYVGLTLVHHTNGSWDWDDAPGFAERAHPPLRDARLLDS